jgi:uncharacterized phage protein (TIGR01671 family)
MESGQEYGKAIMKDIKFRAWDEHKKFMINDFQTKDIFQGVITQDASYCENSEDIYGYQVMQYTGLKDKNGVEIYEGDICHTIAMYEKIQTFVTWNHEQGAFGFNFTTGRNETDWYDLSLHDLSVVIGNIHQNPELLQ